MDPRQLEALAIRLGENPNDTEALHAAYEHGLSDPRGYAVFLEKAGQASTDPASGAHWFCEAATVWVASLSDAHRAERALVQGVDKDPLHAGAVERLVGLHQEKGNTKGIAALHSRRCKALEAQLPEQPELSAHLALIYAELARVYHEELSQPDKAVSAYLKAVEHNPADIYSIYQARELLKGAGKLKEALPLFAAEQAHLSNDPTRSAALFADEAAVCRELGDPEGLIRALRGARAVDTSDDPSLKQELGSAVLERKQAGEELSEEDVAEAEGLFINLAESYDGEYGHSYSLCALELNPANDRAAQLAMYYAEQVEKTMETAYPIAGYLAANPEGLVAEDARALVARALGAGADDALIDALTPSDTAPAAVRAGAFGLIARSLRDKGRDEDATRYFYKVLEASPADEDAVTHVAEQLRGKEDEALRDLLFAAAKDESADIMQRQAWLGEIAELCEGPLADEDGAIEARRQLVLIDPTDDAAADQLELSLEQGERWEDLAQLLLRRAEIDADPRSRTDRELRAFELFDQKLGQPLKAADTLARIVRLEPDDVEHGLRASELYESHDAADQAIALLSDLLREILGGDARSHYSRRLGGLLERKEQWNEAGGAYAEAASGWGSAELWADAERCFSLAEAWEPAARSVAEQVQLTEEAVHKAQLSAKQASYLETLGDSEGALACLRAALEQDPTASEVSLKLESIYEEQQRYGELAALLLSRADNVENSALRLSTLKRAALLQRDKLGDEEGMRRTLSMALEVGEDAEVLRLLAEDAEKLSDDAGAADYLRRLGALVSGEERSEVALRLARLLQELGDEVGALQEYEVALAADQSNLEVLSQVADLRRSVGDIEGAAVAHALLVDRVEGEQKLAAARVLIELLTDLQRAGDAIKMCALVLELDEEDFEAAARARDLAESAELWEDFVRYQRMLVEVEGDEAEASAMARRLASVLETELQRPDEAMTTLAAFARSGDSAARAEYERIGDGLGRQVEIAESLVEWMKDAPAGPERNAALLSAYRRFVDHQRDAQAIAVGLDLVRMKRPDEELARDLERVATRARDLEALTAAFRVVGRELSGPARAEEMVRQAEVLAEAGMASGDAIVHGEQALTSAGPEEVEPLLTRLASLAPTPLAAVEVYERQVSRCKSTADRLDALCRAAEVAFERKVPERVSTFLEIALSTAGHGEALTGLRDRIAQLDEAAGRTDLLAAFSNVLSAGGKNSRDGGRGRAEYLALAAAVSFHELKDSEQAYAWMTEALVAHAQKEHLEQLIEMAEATQQLPRAAECMGQALEQVSDGPLVRLLLKTRFELYAGPLQEPARASSDLKHLYDLSPSDSDIAEELERRYEAAQDHRGLVKLYEDQILRGRDTKKRAELARKVALLWQDVLKEPRETADAWRRVLRMNSGDEEAKEGLTRAKQAMRRVSTEQIAAAEAEARKLVDAQKTREAEEAARREEEMDRKARALQARHSQRPPVDLSTEEGPASADIAPVTAEEAPLPPGQPAPASDEAPPAEEAPASDEAPPAEKAPASDEAPPAESAPASDEAPPAEEAPASDEAPASADATPSEEAPSPDAPSSLAESEALRAPSEEDPAALSAAESASTPASDEETSQESSEAPEPSPDTSKDPGEVDAGGPVSVDEAQPELDGEVEDIEPLEGEVESAGAEPDAADIAAPLPASTVGAAPPPPPSASKAPPPPSRSGGPPLPPPGKMALPPPQAAQAPPPPGSSEPARAAAPGKVPPPPGKVPPPPGKIPPPPAGGGRPPMPPAPQGSGRKIPPPPPGKKPPPPPGKK